MLTNVKTVVDFSVMASLNGFVEPNIIKVFVS